MARRPPPLLSRPILPSFPGTCLRECASGVLSAQNPALARSECAMRGLNALLRAFGDSSHRLLYTGRGQCAAAVAHRTVSCQRALERSEHAGEGHRRASSHGVESGARPKPWGLPQTQAAAARGWLHSGTPTKAPCCNVQGPEWRAGRGRSDVIGALQNKSARETGTHCRFQAAPSRHHAQGNKKLIIFVACIRFHSAAIEMRRSLFLRFGGSMTRVHSRISTM